MEMPRRTIRLISVLLIPTGGTLTTVFAVLIFVVAAYMIWKSTAAFL